MHEFILKMIHSMPEEMLIEDLSEKLQEFKENPSEENKEKFYAACFMNSVKNITDKAKNKDGNLDQLFAKSNQMDVFNKMFNKKFS